MKRQTAKALPPVNVGGANVQITAEQYREYKELQAKRDRSLISLQTQMRLQNAEALNMAREFVKAIDSLLAIQGLQNIAGKAVQTAYEHANELLATE